MSRLYWDHVTRDFGGGEGVVGVDLEVRSGELFVLLGPSGSGKSTLLRLAGGFETPNAGRVWVGEQDMSAVRAERRPTAMVFQSHALWPHMSVFDNIAFGLRVRHRPRAEVRDRVEELLHLVGLDTVSQRMPRQLSGGQRQRVALARALAVEPKVLLLDEPLSALDARLREQLRSELRQLQRRLGTTMVYVTHDQEDALVLAERVAVLDGGRLVQVGAPEDVYEHPATAFVARFCGRGVLLACSPSASANGSRRVRLQGGAHLQVAGGDPAGRWVVVRAEALQLASCAGANRLPARVLTRRYADGRITIDLETAAGGLTLDVAAPGPEIGQTCYIELPADRLWQVDGHVP